MDTLQCSPAATRRVFRIIVLVVNLTEKIVVYDWFSVYVRIRFVLSLVTLNYLSRLLDSCDDHDCGYMLGIAVSNGARGLVPLCVGHMYLENGATLL